MCLYCTSHHRTRTFLDTLLLLAWSYLILFFRHFFFNPFIPMKPPRCKSKNNWLWCHNWTCVLFLFSSSPWRGYSVRGLHKRAELFLKNQCSNFSLRKRTWCCFCGGKKSVCLSVMLQSMHTQRLQPHGCLLPQQVQFLSILFSLNGEFPVYAPLHPSIRGKMLALFTPVQCIELLALFTSYFGDLYKKSKISIN